MPGNQEQPLSVLGPFGGLDVTHSPFYLQPGKSPAMQNVDVTTHPLELNGAIQFGTPLATLATGSGYGIATLNIFEDTSGGAVAHVYIVSSISGSQNISVYSVTAGTTTTVTPSLFALPALSNGLYSTVTTANSPWVKGVQYGNSVYFDNGMMFTVYNDGSGDQYLYQPTRLMAPNLNFGYGPGGFSGYFSGVTTVTSTVLNLIGTYSYAFTYYYNNPNTGIIFESSLALVSTLTENPTAIVSGANIAPAIQFGGSTPGSMAAFMNPDAYTYLRIYRYSIAQPTYQLIGAASNAGLFTLQNLGGGSFVIIDNNTDSSIAGNATALEFQDPAPMGAVNFFMDYPQFQASSATASSNYMWTNPGGSAFLTVFQDRLWVFTEYPNANGYQQTIANQESWTQAPISSELWYSNSEDPTNFNSNSQTTPVGNAEAPGTEFNTTSVIQPYWKAGSQDGSPAGIATTGSFLVLFKTNATYVIYGTSGTSFTPYKAFDIGCYSSMSIAEGDGGVFWLSRQGVYFYDGGSPQYLSEDLDYDLSQYIANNDEVVGTYNNQYYYLTFPALNVSYRYYTPTKQWEQVSAPATVTSSCSSRTYDGIIAVETATNTQVFTPAASSAAWYYDGSITDSKMPGMLKNYTKLILTAPIQTGSVTANVLIDGVQAFTWTWNLANGPVCRVATMSSASGCQGYTVQLQLTGNTGVRIWQAALVGYPAHSIVSTALVDGSVGNYS